MVKSSRPAPYRTHAIQWWCLLAALYTIFIFSFPANKATMAEYNLAPLSYHIILFIVSVPTLFIWLAAFMGYAALGKYSYAVRKSPEAKDFKRLSLGATWLAWSLPLVALSSICLNTIANNWSDFHPSAIIIINYVSLLLPFVAFVLISQGVRELLHRADLRFTIANARIITGLFLVGGITYCYLTFKHFHLESLTSTNNPYFLPGWLMVLTMIIPYLYIWFIGLLSAYQLVVYSKDVQGLLYRKALLYLAFGMAAVIISSIALQYTNAVIPRVGHLMIDSRLGLGVLFKIIGGIGFILLAIGANKLKRIEEV